MQEGFFGIRALHRADMWIVKEAEIYAQKKECKL